MRQDQPDGFAELISECHPVCWSTVDLGEPLGPVPWREGSVFETLHHERQGCNSTAYMSMPFEMSLGVPLTFPFQPWWAGDSRGAEVALKSRAKPQMAPDASLQTAEKTPTCSGGRITCGGQGELGSCSCL